MGIIDRIAGGIRAVQDWWDDDTVMFGNPRNTLNSSVTQKNIINEEIKEQMVEGALAGEFEEVQRLQQQRDYEHLEQIKAIRLEADRASAMQRDMNASLTLQQQREKLAKQVEEKEMARKQEYNRVIAEESFNFYKVGELLKTGLTLQDALTSAGCQENVAFALDRQGRMFIRIEDDACDNVCHTIVQNFKIKDYINTKNGVVVALGFPEMTTFSIGVLIYDRVFGFLLIKTDRLIKNYATNIVDRMINAGILRDKLGFDKIALGHTYMKVAVPCAICINSEYGLEDERDLKQYREMQEYNVEAAKRFNNAVKHFGLKL